MRTATSIATRAMLAALVSIVSVAHDASAQNRSIRVTSFSSGNFLGYFGLGDLGGSIGRGTYQLGTCAFDGIGRTNCTSAGSYVELPGSTNPGANGTFAWRMTWLGNIPNPIQARSDAANSNILTLHAVPAGSFFEVTLSTGQYANLDFGALDTPNPTGGSLNWQAFLGPNATCTGSPANCSVGSVGLTIGAGISSTMSQFDMQLSYPVNTVPEPSAIALVAAGLVGLAAARYRQRRTMSLL